MRRKHGTLTRIETQLLRTAVDLHGGGLTEWHGFQLGKERDQRQGARFPIAFGSLYRALERMEGFGYLASRLEDEATAAAEKRPRRRLYRVTGIGRQVLAATEAAAPVTGPGFAPGGIRA